MSIMNCYQRLPVSFVRGEGVWLWDQEHNQYLDALAGIAVTGLGHCHLAVTRAIQEQAGQLLHCSNLFEISTQQQLAKLLCRMANMRAAFFCNSGAEAVEGAIKLARLYAKKQGVVDPQIVTVQGSFHGRTMAALSAAGNPKVMHNFMPTLSGFLQVPYNNVAAVEEAFTNNPNTIGIMLEPIQGEGGIIIPDNGYLSALAALCQKYDKLLMLDEVQTGMGRTGRLFAYQLYNNVKPDIVMVAKGLANGVPIGAILCNARLKDVFEPGSHGSTFGGNPLATAAGIATLQEFQEREWWHNATKQGAIIKAGLHTKLANIKNVVAIRQFGLMIGIELDRPCKEILLLGLKHRILFSVTADKVMRLLPPLILTDEQSVMIVDRIALTIAEFFS